MNRFSYVFMELIPNEFLQIIKEMALENERDPSKVKTQRDALIDGYGPVYKIETDLFDHAISEIESQKSASNQELDKVRNTIIQSIDSELPLVAVAKEDAQS